ncbi:DUF3868 domain-containing protein [uncultured Bacteroides sp.]|uniref:DUF3868 domain-containing protein n=1 Tax=uncultured Bacteroides sp. TaxID=162156 RepID=UPI002AAB9A7D|nr:DUF3868 domain-containing protein [uncultured Bacteroides sp.]
MKKSLIILFLLAQQMVVPAFAQEVYKGEISLTGKEIYVSEGNLHVRMNVNYEGLKMASNESLTLTPLLKSPDYCLELPSILVNGLEQQKVYHRTEVLSGGKYSKKKNSRFNAPAIVIKNDPKSIRQFSYQVQIPYRKWMKDAVLLMNSRECGCNGKPAKEFQDKIADAIILPKARTSQIKENIDTRYLSLVNIVAPAAEDDTLSMLKGVISFDGDKQLDRLSTEKQNYEIYYRLREAVRGLQQQNGVSVTKLSLRGYGAPIGHLHKNEKQASLRALSLKDYLRENRVAGRTPIEISWTAEDWDSIRSLVQSSDMNLREAVSDIINSVELTKGRERMLMELGDGLPYRYLQSNIFPKVKRLSYAISYTRKGVDTAQGRRLFETGSHSLSLSEFFAVAMSYPKGSTEYNDAMDLTARLFPDSPQAAINAAAVALSKRDTKKAHVYLDKYATLPAAYNNLGILYLLEGNRDKAEIYLLMAAAAGVKEAQQALDELKKK